MLSADLDQARQYIKLLRNDPNKIVCWQMFIDSDDPGTPVVFHSSLDDAIDTINRKQNEGSGAFITINPTNGLGRKIEDIQSYDWLFADIDGDKYVVQDYPLKPTFITSRDSTHGHVYWPVTGVTSVVQYNRLQMQIAMYLGSDRQVIDPARVARVPGFLHLKDPSNPCMYTIAQDNSNEVDFCYEYNEIIEAFKLSDEQQKQLDKFVDNRVAYLSGSGFNDEPMYRIQLRRFAEFNAPIAVKGEQRSLQLYRVAGFGYDRGVSVQETTDILWELYNPRCNPPWTDKEYTNFCRYVDNAYNHAKNALGCKTATGVEWPEVEEPIGGWDANSELAEPVIPFIPVLDDIAYITPEQSAINTTMLSSKSSVHALGIKFIGDLYPYKSLLRYGSVFYSYNGKHWEIKSDEFITAQICRLFAGWEFAPSKIKNIFDAVRMQTFEDGLKRGIYLNDKSKDQVTSIIVNNGIIDIDKGKFNFRNHDRNFFDLNMLPYDYQPTATCPEFLKFINDQWPGNIEMHRQLQEMYGLCLMPNKQHGKFALMIGKSRAGKGVHRDIITALVGKHNIVSPSMENLIEDHTVSAMSKSKVAIIPEANALHPMIRDKVLNRVKAVTGGDSVYYDRKYLEGSDCDLWPFLLIQANEFPDFADSSGALANRVWPFPLTRSFAGIEDRGLSKRLCTDKSISGIFNWALQGLVRVISNDNRVTICNESKEYIDDIRYDTFPLAAFIEDCCILTDSECYADDLHDVYVAYSRTKGIKLPLTMNKFTKMLNASHLAITKRRESSGKRRYLFRGVVVTDMAKQKYKPNFPPIEVSKATLSNE